jgi:hypothetical protein
LTSLEGKTSTAAACVLLKRRSNSASVMLGRVKPVRLSGPGMPPRLIVLLIDHLPIPTRFSPGLPYCFRMIIYLDRLEDRPIGFPFMVAAISGL